MQDKSLRRPHRLESQLRNNKEKREFYLRNPQDHPQVEISGHRKHGSEWKLVCDEGMVELLTILNNNDYNTLFSCQGSEAGKDPYSPAYILLRYPNSEIRFRRLVQLLIEHYRYRVMVVNINELGAINFSMWHINAFDKYWDKDDCYAMRTVIYDPREV